MKSKKRRMVISFQFIGSLVDVTRRGKVQKPNVQ